MNTSDYFNQALSDNGLTRAGFTFDPPTAGKIMKRYKELMKMDKDKIRSRLVGKFMDLNLGDLPEIQIMQLDNLEMLVDQLEEAQQAGALNLETNAGVEYLQSIVDPYLEGVHRDPQH